MNKSLSIGAAIILLVVSWGSLSVQATDIKIATLAPEGSDWMNQMKAGATEIKKRTDGRVNFKFYGGGVMGNDKKVLRKMRNGQLHGGAFTAGGLAERYTGMNLYGLPFLFNNLDEVDAVRSKMDGYVEQGLLNEGLVSFGIAGGGFGQIMSNAPVRSVDDLKGLRVWVPEGDIISYKGMELFDLSPVTLPMTDVLTGLQTGLIDVIGSSAIGALVLQWHTKVSHISTMPVTYLFAVMVVEEKHFNKLSDADQALTKSIFRDVYANLDRQNIIDNQKALKALQSSGLTLVDPNPGVFASMQLKSSSLWQTLAEEKLMPIEKLQEMEALLAAYRQQSGKSKAAVAKTPDSE